MKVRKEFPFTHVHSSGRFDRSVELLARDVKKFHAMKGVTLTTHTEQADDSKQRDAAFDTPGWSFFQDRRDNAYDECVITWKDDFWRPMLGGSAVELSPMTWVRSAEYGGQEAATVKAAYVLLESVVVPRLRVAVIAAHMPLDNTDKRAEAWIDCTRGLHRLIQNLRRQDMKCRFIVSADWNKNFRQADERALLQGRVATPNRLTQAWSTGVPKHGGTHGPKGLIDGDLSNLPIKRAYLLDDTASSDHRPYAVDYAPKRWFTK